MEHLPNLFIIGVAKAGTSALFEMLTQHPEIHGSKIKEPHFFTENIDQALIANTHKANIKSRKEYLNLFISNKTSRYLCEASPSYFWEEASAQRIYDFNPDAKIIVMLRHPIERAHSHYEMDLYSGREKSSDFLQAIKTDQKRDDRRWGMARLYVELGFYANAIEIYKSIFNDQFLVLNHAEFLTYPDLVLQKIWRFLQLEPYDLTSVRANQTVSYSLLGRKMKSLRIEKFVPRFIRKIVKDHLQTGDKKIPQDAYLYLKEIYLQDIKALHSLGYPFYDDIFELT
jgi:hypothetical protein